MPPDTPSTSTAAAPGRTSLHDRRGLEPEAVLEQLAARCVAVLDDVTAAGVLLLTAAGGGVRVAAATCPSGRALEMFAAATNTGPGVDALRTGAQVSCPHIDRDTAVWPGYSAAARDGGFRGAHALPLRGGGRTLGALSLLDTRRRILDSDQRALGQALADDATLAWLHEDTQHTRAVPHLA